MKVAVIRPSWEFPSSGKDPYISNRIWLPLSLAYSAASLERAGHEVVVVDAHAGRLPPESVAEEVVGCDKAFVTSSSLDRWECPNLNLQPFLHTVKASLPVVGEVYVTGAHGTVRPTEILQMTSAKAVVMGEPEDTVADVVRGGSLEGMAGLCFSRDGEAVITGQRPPVDLNELPVPAFGRFPISLYRSPLMGRPAVMLEGSRGCPFSCLFCLKVMFGSKYRVKEPARLFQEIRVAVEEHGARAVNFIDVEFCRKRAEVEELCDMIVGWGRRIRWNCATRVDSVDPPLLAQMAKAGCQSIHYGVELGTQRLLKHSRKGITFEQAARAVRQTKAAGIDALCFFIFGFPGETREDMEETLRLAKKLDPDFVSFHPVVPYPGTKLYEEVKDRVEGLFPVSCSDIPQAALDRFVRTAFLRFYLRPWYLLRQLCKMHRRHLLGALRIFLNFFFRRSA